MSQIHVSNLTFCYEGSYDNIFENVDFSVDTDWKMVLIGRNGKGKTTFLKILLGELQYQGTVTVSTSFEYFPYGLSQAHMAKAAADFLEEIHPDCELWKITRELNKMQLDAEVLYRPYQTLSHGERTKVMLALLFSKENRFLLIDEPTNHLEQDARESIKEYLRQKKGFLLVSHDRDLLDACVDHVLVLNRKSIEVQAGNFSSWWENKSRQDAFCKMQNEKHKKEITHLKKATGRTRNWADRSENQKIGYDPIQDPGHKGKRAYIGAKTKKMESRVKQIEERLAREVEAKEGLLQDIENPVDLKIFPMMHHKKILVKAEKYYLQYEDAQVSLLSDFDFTLEQGDRVFLHGKNGCGKSSLLKAILQHSGMGEEAFEVIEGGSLWTAPGMVISYVNQDTSFLKGSIREFCEQRKLEENLFCALLRQLDMNRTQFVKPLEDYSEGQKKKILLAASLMTPAHLYIWDEPLNYIDVFSRMQIEKLLLEYKPTMLIVEHDAAFRKKIATKETLITK